MTVTKEEAKQLNQERISNDNKARAEAFRVRKEADEEQAWYNFIRIHSNQWGVTNGFYLDCQANKQLLTGWLGSNQLPLTAQTLERAYQENRTLLAQSAEKYQRVSDTQHSRVFPQLKSLEPKQPPAYAPFTREEILSWSKERLHKELGKGKAHVDAINKILAGQN